MKYKKGLKNKYRWANFLTQPVSIQIYQNQKTNLLNWAGDLDFDPIQFVE
jgi:hypothetical protein